MSDAIPLPASGPGLRIHFLGISGIGVSGLASICLERGCVVSGCDSKLNSIAHRRPARGVAISAGHAAGHLDEPVDVVVHSTAVSPEEPELVFARSCGIQTLSRGELLAALAADRRLIAVAGAHGKTTTSGMASQLLLQAGWDPTIIVGGVMLSLGTNARAGRGACVVAESDESDGSFLHLSPEIAIVTNIDREHLNYYQTFEKLVEAFQTFVRRIRPGGVLIACHDDALIRNLLDHRSTVRYGMHPEADLTAEEIVLTGQGSGFRARFRGRPLGRFALQVPGRHNVLNALGVLALGLTLELPP